MTVPKAYCEACGGELRVPDVVLERCPHCGEPITYVVVSRKTAAEIAKDEKATTD